MFSRIFETLGILGGKNTINSDVFAPRKPKTTVFTMFFAFGNKKHGIYSVFVPAPSKNTGIYAVFTMLQDVVPICEKDKNTI